MVTDVADENGTLEVMQYPFIATDCIPERQQAGCSSIKNGAEEQSFMLTGGTQARRSAWVGEGICDRSAGALRGSLAGATRQLGESLPRLPRRSPPSGGAVRPVKNPINTDLANAGDDQVLALPPRRGCHSG